MSAWPSMICTLRRSAPCSTMCVAQLWRRPCGLVEWFDVFTRLQIHWRVRGMPRSERNRRARSWRAALFVRAELIRARCGRPSRRYCSRAWMAVRARAERFVPCLLCREPEHVPHRAPRSLTDSEVTSETRKSARIQQFENRAIAQRRRLRLRMRSRHGCALQHLCHFGLGKRLWQHLPGLWRLDVDRGIVVNAAVEQQPFIKSAQATQLSRGRARIDAMVAQMLEQRGHIGLRGAEQHGVAALQGTPQRCANR